MQALYLLEVGTWKVTLITQLDEDLELRHLSFSLNSQLILIMRSNPNRRGFDLNVYDRSGQRIVHFEDDHLSKLYWYTMPGCLVHAVGDRLAACHSNDFDVWDLRSGRKLGTRGPGPEPSPREAGMAAGQVAANRSGTRLAFCGQGSLDVHLFDAVTLEAQSTLRLAGSSMLAHLRSVKGQLESIVWAGGGFLLRIKAIGQQREAEQVLGLYFLKPQPSSSISLVERLQVSLKGAAQPALAPDGAFVAVHEGDSMSIGVWDTRSGRKVLTHAIDIPEPVLCEYPGRQASGLLQWSSCGSRLLHRVTMCRKGDLHYVLADQITLLQL